MWKLEIYIYVKLATKYANYLFMLQAANEHCMFC
jgi:hypothetical protein